MAAGHSLLSGRRAAPPRKGRSPRGPLLPALRPPPGPSHAVRGAQGVRAEGRPQASSPRRAARSPSAQSFSPRSSFQKGPAQGARRWRRGWRVSAAARVRRPGPGRDSARLGYRDTSTTLLRRGAGAGQRERALWSPLGRGLPGPPREPRVARAARSGAGRSPPSATRRGGAAAAAPGSADSRPANSLGLGDPLGSPVPGPRRPRGARRAGCTSPAAAGVLAAAAPDGPLPPQAEPPPPPPPSLRPTRAHTRPDASAAAAAPAFTETAPAAPPPSGPRPRATPTARAPRSTSAAAPQPGQWPRVWGWERGA